MMMRSKIEEAKHKIYEALKLIDYATQWKHYKGGIYEVQDLVLNTTSGEVDVLYHRIDGPEYDAQAERDISYVRPFAEWFDTIEVEEDRGTFTHQRFIEVEKVTVWQEIVNRTE